MTEVLPQINKRGGGGADNDQSGGEKYRAANWKKISPYDLKKMAPQQRSKYLAYEEPPKNVVEAQTSSQKRLKERRKQYEMENPPPSEVDMIEKDKHEKLIGQLKAAEARNRLRIMRLRYQANRAQEISHLIACQPSALKSVRLQALVPAYPEKVARKDNMEKLDRELVEKLLEDAQGLMTNRTH